MLNIIIICILLILIILILLISLTKKEDYKKETFDIKDLQKPTSEWIFKLRGGLSNRLRFIAGIEILVDIFYPNKTPLFIWYKTNECNGLYEDIFEPKDNIITYTIGRPILPGTCDKAEKIINNFGLWKLDKTKIKNLIRTKYYEQFKLRKDIIYTIDKFIDTNLDGKRYYDAIHYRNGSDFQKFLKDKNINTDKKIVEFTKFMNTNSNKVFLSTDCIETQKYFMKNFDKVYVYKPLIKTKNVRPNSLVDAIIELFICVYAKQFLGTHYSSFSELIDLFRKIYNVV